MNEYGRQNFLYIMYMKKGFYQARGGGGQKSISEAAHLLDI